jgi:hypothetical protein
MSNWREKCCTFRRVEIVIGVALILFVTGLAIAVVFTSLRYGGSALDRIFSGKQKSPASGKLAYDKSTNIYLGVIKAEGYSTQRGAEVYYIERAGGGVIEVVKTNVVIREPSKR